MLIQISCSKSEFLRIKKDIWRRDLTIVLSNSRVGISEIVPLKTCQSQVSTFSYSPSSPSPPLHPLLPLSPSFSLAWLLLENQPSQTSYTHSITGRKLLKNTYIYIYMYIYIYKLNIYNFCTVLFYFFIQNSLVILIIYL